jgi:regulator of replication initiation timing
MKKVAELERKHEADSVVECTDDYIQLAPDVLNLQNQLTGLKQKADDMMSRLTKLQLRWVRIKSRVDE